VEFLSRVPEQSLLLSVRTAMEALRSLAEQLQPRLKGSGGFAPGIPHIMAAVLIARDSLGSRPACRAVPGVPESVHGRVNKLAARVRLLLKDEPQVPPPSAFVSPNVPPPPPSSAFIPSGPMPPRLIAQALPLPPTGAMPNLPLAFARPLPTAASLPPPPPNPDESDDSWDLPPLEAGGPMEIQVEPPPPPPPQPPPPPPPPRPTASPPIPMPIVEPSPPRAPLAAPGPAPPPPPPPLPPDYTHPRHIAWEMPRRTPRQFQYSHPLDGLRVAPPGYKAPPRPEPPSPVPPPPKSQPALTFESFEMPESARGDLDELNYLRRESLLYPELRRLLPDRRRQRRRIGYINGVLTGPDFEDLEPGDLPSSSDDEGAPENTPVPQNWPCAPSAVEPAAAVEPAIPFAVGIEPGTCATTRPAAAKATAGPTDICWNCQQCGHFAADCPHPNRCFRCNQFGHTARNCWVELPKPSPTVEPSVEEAAKTETRWVFFQPPTIKTFRHTCDECGYYTTAPTTKAGGMPRHKCKDGWCFGSGQKPRKSELISEMPDPMFNERMNALRREARWEASRAEYVQEDAARYWEGYERAHKPWYYTK
jgi:hypothetical protein